MTFPVILQASVLLIYSDFFIFMVHGSRVTLISIVISKIPVTAYDMQHRRISSRKKLAQHSEYCEIFIHHIMFIGAFTSSVRGPSILFTSFHKRYHVFIISVIVATRRSNIFIEHFLWHLITVNHSRKKFHLYPACDVQMSPIPYMSHETDLLQLLIHHSLP